MSPTPAREAWQRYVSTGALDGNLLREPVMRAWVRAHTQRASPRQIKAEHLSPLDVARLLQEKQVLVQAARPYKVGVPQPVRLKGHVQKLITLLETEAATRKVALQSEEAAPVTVVADPHRLSRELLRLLLQAFDVASPGGEVSVRIGFSDQVGRVSVTAKPGPGGAVNTPLEVVLDQPLAELAL